MHLDHTSELKPIFFQEAKGILFRIVSNPSHSSHADLVQISITQTTVACCQLWSFGLFSSSWSTEHIVLINWYGASLPLETKWVAPAAANIQFASTYQLRTGPTLLKQAESLKGKVRLIFENTYRHVVMKLNSKSLRFIWKLKKYWEAENTESVWSRTWLHGHHEHHGLVALRTTTGQLGTFFNCWDNSVGTHVCGLAQLNWEKQH